MNWTVFFPFRYSQIYCFIVLPYIERFVKKKGFKERFLEKGIRYSNHSKWIFRVSISALKRHYCLPGKWQDNQKYTTTDFCTFRLAYSVSDFEWKKDRVCIFYHFIISKIWTKYQMYPLGIVHLPTSVFSWKVCQNPLFCGVNVLLQFKTI